MVSPAPQVMTRATASPGPAAGSGTWTSSNGSFGPRRSIAFMVRPFAATRTRVSSAQNRVRVAAAIWHDIGRQIQVRNGRLREDFRGLLRGIAMAALAALTATVAAAQTYPNKPVRVMVGFAPGSGPDVIARTISSQLATDLGQSFVIENRLGANGTIAARAVAQADPDGYTLLFSSSSIASTPFIYKNPNFDVLRDLSPIATSGVLDGYLLLVH